MQTVAQVSIGLFLLATFHSALSICCSEAGMLKKPRNQAKEIGGLKGTDLCPKYCGHCS